MESPGGDLRPSPGGDPQRGVRQRIRQGDADVVVLHQEAAALHLLLVQELHRAEGHRR